MKELLKGRLFQFWEYRVSHGSLFLRSPKTKELGTNVDVMFKDVIYVALPRFLYEIDIVEPTTEEIRCVNDLISPPHEIINLYIILSRERRFSVAAASFRVETNDLEMMESAFPEFRERDQKQRERH